MQRHGSSVVADLLPMHQSEQSKWQLKVENLPSGLSATANPKISVKIVKSSSYASELSHHRQSGCRRYLSQNVLRSTKKK